MKITHRNPAFSTFRKGFTLIELLVVVAIIAVLASISFGPIMSFMDKGKITEVQNNMRMLDTAITSFKEEHGYLPYGGPAPTGDRDENIVLDGQNANIILATLMGKNDAVNDTANVYLTMKEAQGGKNGIVFAGEVPKGLFDHWKNPYTIRLDYNRDGKISKSALNAIFANEKSLEQRTDTMIGATPGKDLDWGEKDIKSWK